MGFLNMKFDTDFVEVKGGCLWSKSRLVANMPLSMLNELGSNQVRIYS